jgi:hypothetical protein
MSEATSGILMFPSNPAYRCDHAGYLLSIISTREAVTGGSAPNFNEHAKL